MTSTNFNKLQNTKTAFNKDVPFEETELKPSPLKNVNYDPNVPIYEAKRYLRQVVVTFKGL